jgi:hypothetical protein
MLTPHQFFVVQSFCFFAAVRHIGGRANNRAGAPIFDNPDLFAKQPTFKIPNTKFTHCISSGGGEGPKPPLN